MNQISRRAGITNDSYRSDFALKELESEIANYIASDPVKMTFKVTTTNGNPDILASFQITTPPACIGAIVGDIVHNLRSALDLTACEIVRASGASDKDVLFPFCHTADDLEQMIKRRKFDRAGESAVNLLRSLKPYKDGNEPLRVIHDLDIHDKHRDLIPEIFIGRSPTVKSYDDSGALNPTVIPGTGSFHLIFPTDIGSQRRELVPTLHELVQLVEGIVAAFRALANPDIPS